MNATVAIISARLTSSLSTLSQTASNGTFELMGLASLPDLFQVVADILLIITVAYLVKRRKARLSVQVMGVLGGLLIILGLSDGIQLWAVGHRVEPGLFWAATVAAVGVFIPLGLILVLAAFVRDEPVEPDTLNSQPQASQSSLAGILTVAQDAVISVDHDQRIQLFNSGAEKILGYSAAEILTQPLEVLLPQQVQDFSQSGEVPREIFSRDPLVARRQDGTEFWAEASISQLEAGGQKICTAILRDITDRMTAEAELQLAHQQLRFHLENTPLAVIEWNQNFRVQYWSPQAQKLFGWQGDEVLGKHPGEWNFIHSEDITRVNRVMSALMDGTQPRNTLQNRNYTKEGIVMYCDWYNSVLRDESGKLISILSLAQDVTATKQAQDGLQASQQMLQLVMDNIPQRIFWKDQNLVYQGGNRKFLEDIGLNSMQELIGKTDEDLPWTLEEIQYDRQLDQAAMESDRPLYRVIGTRRNAEGMQIWIESNKIPLHDPDGKVIGILGNYEDITERKRTLALQKSEARFRKLAQREELLNRLAHQIRNSLELDEILATTVEQVRNLLQIDRCCFIWFCTGNDGVCTPSPVTQAWGEVSCPYWNIVHESKEASLPSFIGKYAAEDVGFWAWQYLQRQIVQIDDFFGVSEIPVWDFLSHFGFASFLSLPIPIPSGGVGVLICGHHRETRAWLESEVELLQSVSDQVAIAIQQAQLYTQATQAAAHAQAQTQKLEATLQQLQQTQTQLIQTEKMSSLGQMVAGVAHEINNPVTFVYSNVMLAMEYTQELLKLIGLYQQHDSNPAEEVVEQIEAIDLEFLKQDLPKLLNSMKMGADRIHQIVLSLRNFSRLDEAEFKGVDLHQGLDSTLLILHNRLKAQSGQPEIQIVKEYSHLPQVECYASQINQVFLNILANAIDALRPNNSSTRSQKAEKPIIWIRTQVIGLDRVAIRIIDNGWGIPPEIHQKLFDPFFTTKPVGQGTGLGLSISYQIIVEKHHGRLECFSQPGKGTEFWIEIPIQQSVSRPVSLNSITHKEIKLGESG